jgi:hypothetical protein
MKNNKFPKIIVIKEAADKFFDKLSFLLNYFDLSRLRLNG